ncbi:DUF5320 domain-containing protein [Candidatus Woesearchaeota archaeon]|nr:DUF5320 domain-containing protein [Candidatus Woesearchaeota archaeon]
MENCCTTDGCSVRQFLTKEEKIEKLQEYKKALETEVKAVQEKINDIKR